MKLGEAVYKSQQKKDVKSDDVSKNESKNISQCQSAL